jgi:hypothetical protein
MRRVLIRVANFAQYICDHFGEGTYSRIVNSLLKSHRWPVRSKTCKYIKRRAPPLDEFHSLNPHIFSIHISSSAGIAVARFWWRNPHPGEFHISSQFTYLLNHISSQSHIFSIHISSQFTYLLNSHIFSITYLLNHISSQSHIFSITYLLNHISSSAGIAVATS